MDEKVLIEAARQGDVASFNRLVLSYQSMVYNLAYRILGDGDAAADATQDAFISAFRGIGKFRGGSFKSWLMRIVTNACYDQLRHKQRVARGGTVNQTGQGSASLGTKSDLRHSANSVR